MQKSTEELRAAIERAEKIVQHKRDSFVPDESDQSSHRPPQPDRVEHCGRREIAVRQLPNESRLHHLEQGRMNAAIGAVGIGEIAFL
jgi:hypothetical protein